MSLHQVSHDLPTYRANHRVALGIETALSNSSTEQASANAHMFLFVALGVISQRLVHRVSNFESVSALDLVFAFWKLLCAFIPYVNGHVID